MGEKARDQQLRTQRGQVKAVDQFLAALMRFTRPIAGTRRRFVSFVFAAMAIHFASMMGVRGGEYTTIRLHIYFAERIAADMMTIIHGMFFQVVNVLHAVGIPRQVGGTLFLAFCVALVAHQTHWYLSRKLEGMYTEHAVCGITAITLVVNALYLPFLTRGVYLGQWGPNVYHNATLTTVKVFSIPVFVLLAALLRNGRSGSYWRDAALAAALLCASLYAKPTLFLAIMPGAALFAVCVRSRWRDRLTTMVVTMAPASAYFLYQYYAAYSVESSLFSERWTEVDPFWVWSQWTKSVPASIALSLAFPAVVAYVSRRERSRDDDFAFAWILVLVGFLQAALLVEMHPESGPMRSANWFGGYLLANHLLYIVACGEFFAWYKRFAQTPKRRALARAVAVLLTLHVVSGIVYLVRLNFVVSAFA